MNGWIGVDLDGTLAHYEGWKGVEHVGAPVPAMLQRVKDWIAKGVEVRIFTARVFGEGGRSAPQSDSGKHSNSPTDIGCSCWRRGRPAILSGCTPTAVQIADCGTSDTRVTGYRKGREHRDSMALETGCRALRDVD